MLIGQRAGNYQLVERLGAGGMGEVYKGVHVTIGSKVAIKVLAATASPGLEERFVREAQVVNRIDHPGIVKVIDAGRMDNGRPYLVMELLEGASLHELKKRGMTLTDACTAMISVLDALAAAHAAGVIHRDLKPANIFWTRDGRIVVLDFGIAKLLAPDAAVRLTITGTAIGTPHYMAPEQIRAQPVTPAADLYAAGVVLFELVCGRRPFDAGDEESVMVGHLERRPPSPRALVPAVSIELADLILAALEKDPARRPPSAAAMRDALRAIVTPGTSTRPEVAPPTFDPDMLVTTPSVRRPREEAATLADSPRRAAPGLHASTPEPDAGATVRERPTGLSGGGDHAPRPAERAPGHRRAWLIAGGVLGVGAIVAIAAVSSSSSSRPSPAPSSMAAKPDLSHAKVPLPAARDQAEVDSDDSAQTEPAAQDDTASDASEEVAPTPPGSCDELMNAKRDDMTAMQVTIMQKILVGWCQRFQWSPDTVWCFTNAANKQAQSACVATLTPVQREELEKLITTVTRPRSSK